MSGAASAYAEAVASFRWRIPPRYNIATACLQPTGTFDPSRVALLRYAPGSPLEPTTYGALAHATERLSAALAANGVRRGDRIAILLPQSVATVVGHLAAYRLGAIAVPLAALFGPDALRYRLENSAARVLLTDENGLTAVAPFRGELPHLETLVSVDGADGEAIGYDDALAANHPTVPAAETTPDDAALMIFTSGTTGPPKGALHGHRVLPGHLPGFQFTHDGPPRDGDRFWTPSDWAWAGGLLNCLLPALATGVPVVFGPFARFDPEAAFRLIAEAGVRNLFLPPTAVRRMCDVPLHGQAKMSLRSIGAAGESLGRETFERARATFGQPVNEFYGQTECNYVIGSAAHLGISRPGSIGMAVPGHKIAILGGDGTPLPPGEAGEIAIARPDPSMFLGYWRDEESTRAKFVGDWMLTGDRAVADDDGYIRFLGRNDDIITSSGYRIGPGEIEDCLSTHPAVALAAVVGRPDPTRTEIVAAYVKLNAGYSPTPEIARELQEHVRARLSAAEYPRVVEFVADIPLTTSGKVIRRHFRGS